MKKKFLYISIIFLLASCSKKIAYNHTEQEESDYARQKTEKTVAHHLTTLGKAIQEDDYLKTKTVIKRTETTFQDSLIEVRYYYQDLKFINVIAFRDTICFVQIISEDFRSLINTVDTVLSDNRFEECKDYFRKMYQTNLDTSTLPKSVIDIRKRSFGIAVGAAGTPTEYGKIYLDLYSKGVTTEEVLKLMTSLNPYSQLIGYLLYNDYKHQIPKSVIDLVEKSTYEIYYSSGCTGGNLFTMIQLKKYLKEYDY